MGFVVINERDNVKVNLDNGHKYALCDIEAGEEIIKYGYPIGKATDFIKKGDRVHTENMKTALSGITEYKYEKALTEFEKISPATISAYVRKSGEIGIRNDIFIINTVGCVNKTAEILARRTGAFSFSHPYGCSQLGGDFENTQKVLASLITHPNAGGVLVLGLGCENNNIESLKAMLGEYDKERVRFLNVQDCEDEISEGVRLIEKLKARAAKDARQEVPASMLKIGLKCGGSDGLSGITANPMIGRTADRLVSMGACAVLTEVPEMFGAEQILMNRCVNEAVFKKAVSMINGFKEYFISHGQPISENPSPGNKAGGITTLEEKSLGCVQKGGHSPVVDVLGYAERVKKQGLSLLWGPGNDMVAVTDLAASGCHMILFSTGRGTPLGAPVPTVKISTNAALYRKKPHWIDFDAQSGTDEELFSLIIDTANGKLTESEKNGYREIAIFKDGVTL